ncbi:conserved Plasmodium protein, unknown function [Plasmodium gallinaceum]|uniref:Uncharacterized protein n=1 Tax=Plasmodium gallinaceum TaxID=5849 RepID=A0A1J1GUL8_PLAGA|nr:conserved Plasmodium protein, unknown function [Plasmodium gallinaceum]CRG94737.1 conserved Plasmodium protein, unknown function [Plasmodium gallinaceum]
MARMNRKDSIVLVSLKKGLNKNNINFIDYEDKYDFNVLKNHLKDLKKLKEDVIKSKNESKELIKDNLDKFLYDYNEKNCNFDVFYDKCLQIIERYLIIYKEINELFLKKDLNKDNESFINPDNSFSSSEKNKNKLYEKQKKKSLLNELIDNNILIHNNKFLFDYDDDSEIYTSSEEEIVIEKNCLKKINFKNNKNENNMNNSDDLSNNESKISIKSEDNCTKTEKYKVENNYKKTKINLLNRYPSYLRDLIKIVKNSKKREKRILQIKLLNKHCKNMEIGKINTLFYKIYLYNCYLYNKSYIKKKKRRILYRILRYNMLNYCYNNHDIFFEKMLKKKNKYNSLSKENIEKLFIPHDCTNSVKTCKSCKENIKILFYITIYDNLNYPLILKNSKVNKKINLLTHIFINKEKCNPINVDYDIVYHQNKYIYMTTKNNIFCHILHANYLKDNFNDLLLRIKKGSKGYNLLNVIFNKYKNNNFLSFKKLKKYLEDTKNQNILCFSDDFYDVLKPNIINDENYSNVFFDKIFFNFYNLLYTDKTGITRESRLQKKKPIEIIKNEEDDDSDDFLYLDSRNNIKKISNNDYLINQISSNDDILSFNGMNKKYMNVKKIKNIDDKYIDDVWDCNIYKYRYIANYKCNNRKNDNVHCNSFENYLNKINEEIAIVLDSDDSDNDIKNSFGKVKNLMNYLKGKNYKNSNTNNKINILEKSNMLHLKKNFIIHPLINSKCIGFKIEVDDISDRKLDIYCINNSEYVNIYKNTIDYLKNNINENIKKNYNEYKNIKHVLKKKEKLNGVYQNFNKVENYINSKSNNTINEYIVVIDENIEEETYKIDIYNYAELTTYIVNSKKEKKKEFYSNFVRNEIYSHKWINRLQFKLLNYSNFYKNSFFKKNHMRLIKDYLYGLLINSYYENIYDVSLNLLLSKHYEHYDPSKQFVLKNMSYNINQIYESLMNSIKNDIMNNKSIIDGNNVTEENMQLKVNDYLLNYKWNDENKDFSNKIIDKYRFILLYYLLYLYPKFLYILNIIQIQNFKDEIKITLPLQEEQQMKEIQKDFTSEKKILKSAKHNKIENHEEKEIQKDFYIPPYIKNRKDNNILNSFSLQSLLLVNFYERFENSLFLNILNKNIDIESVQKEIHPICYKTLIYYNKNESLSIKKKLTIPQLSTLFIILNSYLSFATIQHYSFFNKNNIWKFLIYKFSETEKKKACELISNGDSYFPSSFLQNFMDTFLVKQNDRFIVTDKIKCKLMIYILLIQLCITDNTLPISLSLINRNTGNLLNKLNFSIKDKIITFNLQA